MADWLIAFQVGCLTVNVVILCWFINRLRSLCKEIWKQVWVLESLIDKASATGLAHRFDGSKSKSTSRKDECS